MPQPKRHASAAERQAAYRERQRQVRSAERAAKGLPASPPIPNMPGQARWKAALATAHELIEGTIVEMQDYFDDRSEEWQESERGETFQERLDAGQELLDALSDYIP